MKLGQDSNYTEMSKGQPMVAGKQPRKNRLKRSTPPQTWGSHHDEEACYLPRPELLLKWWQQEHLLGQETPLALSVLNVTARHAKNARPLPCFIQAQGCCREQPWERRTNDEFTTWCESSDTSSSACPPGTRAPHVHALIQAHLSHSHGLGEPMPTWSSGYWFFCELTLTQEPRASCQHLENKNMPTG